MASSGAFLSLAESLAQKQPHGVKVSRAPIAAHDKRDPQPTLRKDKARKLMRPNNPYASPRSFMESPRQRPLSIKD